MDKKECSRENKESERSDRASDEKKQYKHVLLGTSESDHLICSSTVVDQVLKVLWIGRNGEGRFLSSSGTSIQAR